jgi:NNP family nitrate/nitrite transporter-like MFS transporter
VAGVYIPLIVAVALGSAYRMDNLSQVRNEKRAVRDAVREPHAWIMSLLYIGTFGSFIGFGFAFGQVLQVQFHAEFRTPVEAAYLTFLGPLLGSLARPLGGALADRLGGATVSLAVFVAMAAGTGTVLLAAQWRSLPLYAVGFVALFVCSGIGNGSTYKMIPAIFRAKAALAVAAGCERDAAEHDARRLANAVIGIAAAVGAFGGVGVNIAFRQSFLASGTGDAAYIGFIAFYLAAMTLTWLVYVRPSPNRLPSI